MDSNQQDALNYISKLTGRSTDSLISDAVEEWLVENYIELVGAQEIRRGLPSTTTVSAKAHRTMLKNLEELATV